METNHNIDLHENRLYFIAQLSLQFSIIVIIHIQTLFRRGTALLLKTPTTTNAETSA